MTIQELLHTKIKSVEEDLALLGDHLEWVLRSSDPSCADLVADDVSVLTEELRLWQDLLAKTETERNPEHGNA